VRDVFHGVEVLVAGGNLDGAAPAIGAEEEFAAGIRHVGAVDVDPVVVETLVQRACGAGPGAVFALRQSDSAPLGHPYALGLRRNDAKTRAALGIPLRVLPAGLIGARWFEVLCY